MRARPSGRRARAGLAGSAARPVRDHAVATADDEVAPDSDLGVRPRIGRWLTSRCGRAAPTRSAPPGTAWAPTSALFSEVAERVELCLFDERGRRDPHPAARGHRLRVARLPARRGPGPAVRLPGPRPVRPGAGPALQPGQAAGRPVREGARRGGDLAPVGVRLRRRRPARPRSPTRSTAPRTCRAVGGRRPVVRLGRRPPAGHPLARVGDLRGARQGHVNAPPGRARAAARHLRRAGAPRRDRAPHLARGHGRRAAARARAGQRAGAGRARADQLLGLQLDRLPRARGRPTPRRPELGGAVGEFKRMVKDLHAAGIEVILDVVYNHTAEGDHTGPDPVVARHRQRRLLPARRRRPAPARRLHRVRQQPRRPQPPRRCS